MPIDDQPVDGGNLGSTGVHTGLAQRVSDDPQPNRLWLTCNTLTLIIRPMPWLESLVSPATQARGASVDTAADDAGQSTAATASPITSSDR